MNEVDSEETEVSESCYFIPVFQVISNKGLKKLLSVRAQTTTNNY